MWRNTKFDRPAMPSYSYDWTAAVEGRGLANGQLINMSALKLILETQDWVNNFKDL